MAMGDGGTVGRFLITGRKEMSLQHSRRAGQERDSEELLASPLHITGF